MTKKTFRKKYITILFCVVILINLALPAWAATGVPQEVLDAVDSVVFIGFMVDTEDIHPSDVLDLKMKRPGLFYTMHGRELYLYSRGSGFVIKNEVGEVLIATNNHVVKNDTSDGEIYVWLSDSRIVHAEIVFAESKKDLSVIRIRENTDKKALPLAAEDAQRGDAAYAVGFPGTSNEMADGEIANTSDEATITDGIISTIRPTTLVSGTEAVKMLQMNVAINGGNSGGPLFNEKGEVTGINTLSLYSTGRVVDDKGTVKVDVSDGIHGAIAVSELRGLLKEYDIDIPAPAKLEVTEPVIPETTAPAVPETTEPAVPDATEVTVPVTPTEPAWEPGMILVICGVAVVGAVALSLLLAEEKKKAKKKKPVMNKRKKPIIKKDPVDGYIVKPKLPDEVVIEMTPSRKKSETAEKDPSSEDYFKGIKL